MLGNNYNFSLSHVTQKAATNQPTIGFTKKQKDWRLILKSRAAESKLGAGFGAHGPESWRLYLTF